MNYIKIENNSIANGIGIRVVLWVSGCEHECKECHNSQTWDLNAGFLFTNEDYQKVRDLLEQKHIEGITFSGGDPLHPNNAKTIIRLSKSLKESYPNKTQWLYTGYTFEEIKDNDDKKDILNTIDVLVDGKFVIDLKNISLPYCGSSNQRVIDVPKSLKNNSIIEFDKK